MWETNAKSSDPNQPANRHRNGNVWYDAPRGKPCRDTAIPRNVGLLHKVGHQHSQHRDSVLSRLGSVTRQKGGQGRPSYLFPALHGLRRHLVWNGNISHIAPTCFRRSRLGVHRWTRHDWGWIQRIAAFWCPRTPQKELTKPLSIIWLHDKEALSPKRSSDWETIHHGFENYSV